MQSFIIVCYFRGRFVVDPILLLHRCGLDGFGERNRHIPGFSALQFLQPLSSSLIPFRLSNRKW